MSTETTETLRARIADAIYKHSEVTNDGTACAECGALLDGDDTSRDGASHQADAVLAVLAGESA